MLQLDNQFAKRIIEEFNKTKHTFTMRYWNFEINNWRYLGYAELWYFDSNIYNIVEDNGKKYLEVIEGITYIENGKTYREITSNKEQYELDDFGKKILDTYLNN